MTRRLSLAGQLLALQVVIICVVLIGVGAVTVAQSTKRAQEVEGRRALVVAETLANARATREAMEDGEVRYLRVAAEIARSNSGSASVVVARADRTVLATADPEELGARFDVGDSTVLSSMSNRVSSSSGSAVARTVRSARATTTEAEPELLRATSAATRR